MTAFIFYRHEFKSSNFVSLCDTFGYSNIYCYYRKFTICEIQDRTYPRRTTATYNLAKK